MEWQEFLYGDENISFLLEIALRSFVMFWIIFLGLRVAGKRGVRQLSIFELLIIISLGSAAGDPMIYKEIGVLSSLVAFVVVIFVYRVITRIIGDSAKMEDLFEGDPMYVVRDGRITEEALKKKILAGDEFFAAFRNHKITHLGEVDSAIMETNGEISVLLNKKEDVKPGLAVWPHLLSKMGKNPPYDGNYACSKCGNTGLLKKNQLANCSYCHNDEWVEAISK